MGFDSAAGVVDDVAMASFVKSDRIGGGGKNKLIGEATFSIPGDTADDNSYFPALKDKDDGANSSNAEVGDLAGVVEVVVALSMGCRVVVVHRCILGQVG